MGALRRLRLRLGLEMGVKHTPGPWHAEMTKGWGGDLCIIAEGHTKPIFKAIKPDSYYTDFPPGREPGSKILSTSLAAAQGRYVSTPEIRAEIDFVEEANARLIAAAPELLEACKAMLEAITGVPDSSKVNAIHLAVLAINKAQGQHD